MSSISVRDLHAYHTLSEARERRQELYTALGAVLKGDPRAWLLQLDTAINDEVDASWALFESLRRLGVKERAAQRIATGEADR